MLIILFDQDISFIIQSIEKLMRKSLHGYPFLISKANEKLDLNWIRTQSLEFLHLIKLGYSIGESLHIARLGSEFSPTFLILPFGIRRTITIFLNNYINVEIIEKLVQSVLWADKLCFPLSVMHSRHVYFVHVERW